MADIRVTQAHHLTPAQARLAAGKVADHLASEYDLVTEWVDEVLHFKRSGVSGTLQVHEREATLEISLDLLFQAFAPVIEQKVAAKMAKVFG